jgi:hypothetical protein
MKSIMSVLVVTIMVFGLVSSSVAGWLPGDVPTGTPYACGVASPAYTHYTDAVALPCADRDRDASRLAPEPMGSPGF